MEDSKAMAVDSADRQPSRTASIDAEVAALLDHIAEELAREYVRLMEDAAQEGGPDSLRRQEGQEA